MIGTELMALIVTGAAEANHFDWFTTLKNAVNLLILLIVLGHFLKRPLKNFFVERRALIAGEIEDAQEKIKGAKDEFDAYSAKMREIGAEIESLKESIRKEAALEREQMLEEAARAAARVAEEMKETIRIETEKARQEILDEVVNTAAELAEKALGRSVSDADEKRFLDDFIKTTEVDKWHQ